MLFNFANILAFFAIGLGFVFVSLLLSRFLSPRVPFREKLATYECGEIPTEGGRINFNIRFYIIALVFIVFDVEIAFMFPVGTIFREWVQQGRGLVAFVEIALFILILLLGLVYVWRKGDFEWMKQVVTEDRSQGMEIVPKASRVP
ncbi:MAG: NADH-quinone oxidoreductase subunit A [Deltaproteobacteria bacterium]|nr:NADH-quinone oxidoreductase subunit A [Deltaproteobacteria bacterium]